MTRLQFKLLLRKKFNKKLFSEAYKLFKTDDEFIDFIVNNSKSTNAKANSWLNKIRVKTEIALSSKDKLDKKIKKVAKELGISADIPAQVKNKINLAIAGKHSMSEVINDFERLYHLLMAKAQGLLQTKEIIVKYSVEVKANGDIINKKIATKSIDGKEMGFIDEKNIIHAPNENVLKHIYLLREVIDTMRGRDEDFLTTEEIENRYFDTIQNLERQKARIMSDD